MKLNFFVKDLLLYSFSIHLYMFHVNFFVLFVCHAYQIVIHVLIILIHKDFEKFLKTKIHISIHICISQLSSKNQPKLLKKTVHLLINTMTDLQLNRFYENSWLFCFKCVLQGPFVVYITGFYFNAYIQS